MSNTADRLYNLLPVVYRQRDLEHGGPLRQVLSVIAEQVDLIEEDIAQLYDNWFIETCDDWVIPYIGKLIGYEPVREVAASDSHGNLPVNKVLSQRREVANTIGFRRRKGTLWLLEQLTDAVAGWPARVVEFERRLGRTQSIDHLHLRRGRTADLRAAEVLDLTGTPFDLLSRTLEVRSIESGRSGGSYNVQNVGIFVWRLKAYSATRVPAYCLEEAGDHCYTFSILGNDVPLHNLPVVEAEPTDIAGELNLPTPIRRQAFEQRTVFDGAEHIQASERYYGEGRSLAIWAGTWAGGDPAKPLPAEKVIPADLSEWRYRPRNGHVAVDSELGRIAFPPSQLPEQGVWVSYHYAFATEIGGGEYQRPIITPSDCSIYRVGKGTQFPHVRDAYEQWARDRPASAVIEIADGGVYEGQVHIEMAERQSLEIRAANGVRPCIYLADWHASRPDALTVTGGSGSRFALDGILVTGRGIEVRGNLDELAIRHCTLVPGWSLHPDCRPRRPSEPSLALANTTARIRIERSIIGAIHVIQEDVFAEPIMIRISDSIVDATSVDSLALGTPDRAIAPVVLTAARSSMLGQVHVHAIELAENCIFAGHVLVARRQLGCMRFCYIPPGARTPARFRCQPDLVDQAADALTKTESVSPPERDRAREAERLRVEPQFVTTRYGGPAYCRLAQGCADEIKRGAEDQSEMGVFHDLFEPQRTTNLRIRLAEYVPAGTDVGIIFAS
jgi:hypothetical protein